MLFRSKRKEIRSLRSSLLDQRILLIPITVLLLLLLYFSFFSALGDSRGLKTKIKNNAGIVPGPDGRWGMNDSWIRTALNVEYGAKDVEK